MDAAVLNNKNYRRHFIRITALAEIPKQATYTPPTNEGKYAAEYIKLVYGLIVAI